MSSNTSVNKDDIIRLFKCAVCVTLKTHKKKVNNSFKYSSSRGCISILASVVAKAEVVRVFFFFFFSLSPQHLELSPFVKARHHTLSAHFLRFPEGRVKQQILLRSAEPY